MSFPNLYYFDINRRVYTLDGERKSSPFHVGYYVPIKIVSETPKEFICEYGTINKKSGLYSIGRNKHRVYTEKERDDDVYVNENRHKIIERLRSLNADALRMVEDILIKNNC